MLMDIFGMQRIRVFVKDVGRDSENVELVGERHGDAKIGRNYTVR